MDKEPVKLRRRTRPNGTISLYLDTCINGVRTNEYLKLYLIPERTRQDRDANRKTLEIANTIKARRIIAVQSQKAGFTSGVMSDKILFLEFFKQIADSKEGTTHTSWMNALQHIKAYDKRSHITLLDITTAWVRGFREYLDKKATQWCIDDRKRKVKPLPISEGTKALMFQKLTACLNEAVRQDLLPSSPAKAVKGFGQTESEREYLTLEELRRLAEIPCPAPEIGRMFLFACLTGLRWSDVCGLRWSNVMETEQGTRLIFTQKKTRALEYLDISSQAASFLGDRGDDGSFVFRNSMPTQTARPYISAWVRAAGINKHITFHCLRHYELSLSLNLNSLQRFVS